MHALNFIIPLAVLFSFVMGLAFWVRVFCALDFEKSAQQIKRHPIRHGFWAIPGIFSAFVLLLFIDPRLVNIWPPDWLARKHDRQMTSERVRAAGGWEAVRKDCMVLAATNQIERFFWLRMLTNHVTLPPALTILNPQQIEYYSTNWPLKKASEISVVHIKMFGFRWTDSSAPFYGLDVICGNDPQIYNPADFPGSFQKVNYRKVAEGIYEVY